MWSYACLTGGKYHVVVWGYAGKQAHSAPDVGLLALLARYYNEVADVKPQLDLIPLFPFAAWSLGQHD